jgi:hypothetical protein
MSYPTIMWDVANTVKTCASCRTTYIEKNNIGRWECRVHPGNIEGGVFTCCGQRTIAVSRDDFVRRTVQPELLGCRACDHSAMLTTYEYDDKCQFPERYLLILHSKRESIVGVIPPTQPGVGGVLICSRIDRRQEKSP